MRHDEWLFVLGVAMLKERIFRFDDFEADLATGELFKGGLRIPLQEKPFRVLAALVKSPGKVLTREELRRKLWADGIHLDFDHSLNIAVAKLRHALSDRSDRPQFIKTVGRRGYQFILPNGRSTAW